jgi:hypothetical protein
VHKVLVLVHVSLRRKLGNCDEHDEQREGPGISKHPRCRVVDVDKLLIGNGGITSCRVAKIQSV